MYIIANEFTYVVRCPYKIGDILWVREKFRYCQPNGSESLNYQYFSDMSIGESALGANDYLINDYDKWRPSLFMPKKACRIFLKVTNVRPERLLDISESDAIKEGIQKVSIHNQWYNYLHPKNAVPAQMWVRGAKESFFTLWQKINGPESLKSNPWIWVVEFQRIEKPENFK